VVFLNILILLITQGMKLTNKLVILCVLTFVFAQFLPAEFVAKNFFYSLGNFLEGRVYVAITALFMHANIMHLLINLGLLYFIGNLLEDLIGVRKYAIVFFFGGAAAFLLSSLAYGRANLLVGASGSIFTIMAVAFVMNPLAVKKTRAYSFVFGKTQVATQTEEVTFSKITFFVDVLIASIVQLALIGAYSFLSLETAIAQGVLSGDLGHVIGFLIGFVFGVSWSERWSMYAKQAGRVMVILFILLVLGVYTYYSFVHAVNPHAQTFIDTFLSSYSIEIFQSGRARCNNFCLDEGFDYGELVDGFCECKFAGAVNIGS